MATLFKHRRQRRVIIINHLRLLRRAVAAAAVQVLLCQIRARERIAPADPGTDVYSLLCDEANACVQDADTNTIYACTRIMEYSKFYLRLVTKLTFIQETPENAV